MAALTAQEKRSLIDSVPFWYHSIDCGDGIVTSGVKPPETLQRELRTMALPRLEGKSVLDVGAWDGYFSFAAEEAGARRVVALDHYVWSMDLVEQQRYWRRCRERRIAPQAYDRVPGHWQPGRLPGKRGFDVVHRIRQSAVEQVVADFMSVDLVDVGQFDVVFFLGVLYHLEEPFRALKRLALVTRELAVIETAAVLLPAHEELGMFEFYESNELGADVGNWFAPSLAGLRKACRAAGFGTVEAMSPYPPPDHDTERAGNARRYRLTVHAWK